MKIPEQNRRRNRLDNIKDLSKIKGKKLAVLGASYMAGIFMKEAKKLGIKTYCFAWEEGAVAKEDADEFYPISVMEKERIAEMCRNLQIDGILTTTEAPIASCAFIADQLGINGNPIEVARNITNKAWVRKQMKACSLIKSPFCKTLLKEDDFNLEEWRIFPAIVKPASGGGKRGVVVVNSHRELGEAVKYALSYDKKGTGVLLEQYISEGKEYSVESLSFNGKHTIVQITEKISSGPPYCVELGHHQPAQLSKGMWNKVSSAIRELLNVLSIKNGPSHSEIKIVGDTIYLIEINDRPGGDHIATTLIPLSTGYDYVAEILKVALNIPPDELNTNYQKCSGVYFVTKQTQRLKTVFDNCENEEWLFEKHVENRKLTFLTHNDCMHTNYMIYCSDHRIEL